MFDPLFDLGDPAGVHVEVGRYSVHKLTASKSTMHLDRIVERQAATRPPYVTGAHLRLAWLRAALNGESERGTVAR